VVADHQRHVVHRFEKLVVGGDIRGGCAIGDLTFGAVGILPAEHRCNVLQAEAITVELRRIHIHAHSWQGTAANTHLPDSLNLGKTLLHDGGSRVVELAAVVHI